MITPLAEVSAMPFIDPNDIAPNPLTDGQIYEKFPDCLDAGGSDIPADTLFQRLSAIQSMSAREITALD
jgi:hypothetical protein